MNAPKQSERLQAVAALNDPVRRALFEFARNSREPVSRDDCASALELPASTARLQLDRLVDAGVLQAQFRKTGVRTGPGSGRPTKLYSPAVAEVGASIPDRHYGLAAELLAGAVQRSTDTGEPVRTALAQVARMAGTGLGEEAGSVRAVLEEIGYDPRPAGAGTVVLANCPFHQLVHKHSDVVCALNGALLSGVLAGCGDTAHAVVPDPDRSHCCARIVPNPPAPQASAS